MLVDKLPKVKKSEAAQLYMTSDFEYGNSKNLAMEPSLLNNMLRCTVLPKVSNFDAICNTLGVRLAFWHLHCMSLRIICSYMSMEHM
jgi:hypothetical protein